MGDKVTPEEIAEIRRVRGWSSARLAQEIGCSQATAWRMENKKLKIGGMANRQLLELRDSAPVADQSSEELDRIKDAAAWIASESVSLETRKSQAIERFSLSSAQAEHAIAEAKLIWARSL